MLFVCSGNVCRSPMAAAMLEVRRGKRSAWCVTSAGTMALAGLPASEEAIVALAEIGIDLTGHRSRPLLAETMTSAALIVPMTRSHRDTLLRLQPQARDKVFLLRGFEPQPGASQDLEDPIGGSLATYRNCRDAIQACLPGLLRFLRDIGLEDAEEDAGEGRDR
ncbi:MAG: low molecular weight protein arginine phosphatase [Kiritimatiellae bacterium]|nr:low molecular weight protein arginine phosphatase [Kiritimatiellia bacterium]